jgi:hypothetical protein
VPPVLRTSPEQNGETYLLALGTEFPDALDDWTWDRILHVHSEGSSSFPPMTPFDLYGECPEPRREFDRLTLAPPPAGAANELLAFYTDGNPADEGRAAVIGNVRAGGGAAVLAGFDFAALFWESARVCLLDAVLDDTFGLVVPNEPWACSIQIGETLDAKAHERTWDGRVVEGRAVSNGIYFVRLVTSGADVRQKVVRSR